MSSSRRVLPHNLDAEKSVLGGILLRNDALTQLATLEEEDFYDPKHRAVFAAMRALEAKARPIDPVTLEEELAASGKLEAVGGLAFLSELAIAVPTADNITHYAEIVQDKHAARKLMLAASEIAAKGYGDYGDIGDYLDEAETRIFEVTQRTQRGAAKNIKTLLKSVFESLDSRFAATDGITGIPTGYHELDQRTAGLQPSDLVILAARPAMGKTSLAMSIVQNCALGHGIPVLVFSLEMSSTQLAERMLCSEARIDSSLLRRGQLQRQDMTNLTYAANNLSKAPIYIDDTPALSVREVRAKARRFVGNRELFPNGDARALVVIDYLQLMRGTNLHKNANREQEISEISRGLKALAKEINCPVLALSQLNRSLESRADKRPMLSDLRESGAIEQDADLILFIYRDEVYSKEACERPGIAEVIIGKNRHGPVATVELRFEGRYTRFDNLSHRDDDYEPPPSAPSPDAAPF
ncbi:MAG: replicative DNA helicase [Deltaproteobacteria bacterium]|nr:MAG: replicative DNA helicase [Deltaproteobacteria bacterium]